MKKLFRLLLISLLLMATLAGCQMIAPAKTAPTAEPTPEATAEPVEEATVAPETPAEDAAASPAIEDGDRHVYIEIAMEDGGIIELVLDRVAAPITVDNFVSLVNDGFYDGLTFHRIVPGFVIQGGDPDGNGTGGPGHQIFGEFTANGWDNPISHERGVISMARSQSFDSAGSQFFIVLDDAAIPSLDGGYAAFGKVINGMDVVDAIASVQTSKETPVKPVIMKTVRVKETE